MNNKFYYIFIMFLCFNFCEFYLKKMAERDINQKLIFNKYRIKKLIFKTSCCLLYEGINIKDKEPVALKLENRSGEYNVLESEAYLLYYLKGFGIPKIITYGKSGVFNILIQELLGLSIDELWKLKNNKNEKELLKDICMIALQCIERLEYIHSKDIIHGDIKPQNFLIGRKNPKIIYLIDFGFAHRYRSSRTGKHIIFKKIKMIYGSFKFMSLNGNKGYEISRRDDLESLGYMLIFLAKNNLPWTNIEFSNKNDNIIVREVLKIKNSTTPEILCQGLPEEFTEFIKYCKNLYFEQDPNYNYLKSLFTSILLKNGKTNDLLFFWNINKDKKEKKEDSFEGQRNSFITRNGNFHKRLYDKIKKSLITKNKTLNKEDTNNIKKIINKNHDYKIINNANFQIIHKNNNINTDILNTNNILRIAKNILNIQDDFKNMGNNISYFNKRIISNNNIKNKVNILADDENQNKYNIQLKLKRDINYKTFYQREELKKKNSYIFNDINLYNTSNNDYYSSKNENKRDINNNNNQQILINDYNRNNSTKYLENKNELFNNKNKRNVAPLNNIKKFIINTPNNKSKKSYIKEIPTDWKRKQSKNVKRRNFERKSGGNNYPIFFIKFNNSAMNNFYDNNINITINNS